MRLRHNKYALDILNESNFTIQKFPYQLNNNVVLEIGMGKGRMINQLAKLHPENIYIGIEKYSTPALSSYKKLMENNLTNLYLLIGDASQLNEYFTGRCKTIWLTFSDPWPKKRHFKRRLVYRDFLAQYKNILDEDGIVYFKSDNDGLYQFALEELQYFNANIIYHTNDLHNCDYDIENHLTDYEEKFHSMGKNINFIAFNFKKNL
ncbi:tRNA (guanine-N(7)-)-methyltransferase [Metamycoplasma cloacale]|uniref:tRNA (guanine-N(7)-)-methyltransferase n=1 Tax=Metamycoplasma cloacale TaxID=92401 RepID=A0A2Z4LLG9_9BACT|nr:tRNA (guanosine(46)-N7)-methyltransferase TrmB [Metamycoplasma cloacale]AWX42611.1 tRNA (guanosine(46)-N7)-methyltransferase TrmB [Metamycoplasma cloacale]VEU79640.1 tRNA (guanine-N(7)-)-methyltransferase [Metamycoplasma cloacale]